MSTVLRKFVLYVVEEEGQTHETSIVQDLVNKIRGENTERQVTMLAIDPLDLGQPEEDRLSHLIGCEQAKDFRNLSPRGSNDRDLL
jgi:hypothetical protein